VISRHFFRVLKQHNPINNPSFFPIIEVQDYRHRIRYHFSTLQTHTGESRIVMKITPKKIYAVFVLIIVILFIVLIVTNEPLELPVEELPALHYPLSNARNLMEYYAPTIELVYGYIPDGRTARECAAAAHVAMSELGYRKLGKSAYYHIFFDQEMDMFVVSESDHDYCDWIGLTTVFSREDGRLIACWEGFILDGVFQYYVAIPEIHAEGVIDFKNRF